MFVVGRTCVGGWGVGALSGGGLGVLYFRNCYLCCWLFVSFELGCLALVLCLGFELYLFLWV